MQSERNIVVNMRSGLYHFFGIVTLLSNHSTIFIAGKAININITMEKVSVRIICIIFVNHNTEMQSLSLPEYEG